MEEFTVSQLSTLIKQAIEQKFCGICLRAEVSALKIHSSGHLYFSLKDSDAVIDAVCWKGVVAKHKIKLEDGLAVKCIGHITTYPKRSTYQFIVEAFELAGIGELLKILEERKKKLMAEHLFDIARKKPIPKIPRLIGIITSPTGAVIKDMMHRINQRFPKDMLLWPVAVQGNEASKQIVDAIIGMNNLKGANRPDLLIVARGGGSFEDLMPFNEENVVRAVSASNIPVISAVGHEIDTTLIDYAADLRAPTPTAAAEFAVPERIELASVLSRMFAQLNSAIRSVLERNRLLLNSNKITSLQNIVAQKAQTTDFSFEKLTTLLNTIIANKKILIVQLKLTPPQITNNFTESYNKMAYVFLEKISKLKMQFEILSNKLENSSYTNILNRGFALVKTKKGRGIPTAQAAMSQSEFDLIFCDGKVSVSRKATQTSLSLLRKRG